MGIARVFIIDEHPAVGSALAECLDRAEAVTVIGYCEGANEAIMAVQEIKPDVVLIETKRSDGMGLEILRQVAALPSRPHVVVLTSYPSKWEEEAARRAGAKSYLLKNIDSAQLIHRISQLIEV